jgi:hypothetical protein
MMKTLVLTLVLPFCITTALFCQDNIEGIKLINYAYANNERLSMDISYKLFDSWDAKQPASVEKGALKRSGKLSYTKIGPVEMIRNLDYNLIVDHEDKAITILAIFEELPDVGYSSILTGIEKTARHCSAIKHADVDKNRAHYELLLPDGISEYKKIVLEYHKSTHLLSGIFLFYAKPQKITEEQALEQQPRLEIVYSNINTYPVFEPTDFTYQPYLKKSGNTFVCTDKYRAYELIDNYSKF